MLSSNDDDDDDGVDDDGTVGVFGVSGGGTLRDQQSIRDRD